MFSAWSLYSSVPMCEALSSVPSSLQISTFEKYCQEVQKNFKVILCYTSRAIWVCLTDKRENYLPKLLGCSWFYLFVHFGYFFFVDTWFWGPGGAQPLGALAVLQRTCVQSPASTCNSSLKRSEHSSGICWSCLHIV